jgi:hypothetical protein
MNAEKKNSTVLELSERDRRLLSLAPKLLALNYKLSVVLEAVLPYIKKDNDAVDDSIKSVIKECNDFLSKI